IQLAAGAAEAVRSLSAAGFRLVVITNQSGVARGLFPISALGPVRTRVEELVRQAGAEIAGFYFCPPLRRGSVREYTIDSACRKPAPGLILQAASEHHIELAESWMVGDKWDDVEAGRRAGCRTVLLSGDLAANSVSVAQADLIAPDWKTAVDSILGI